MEAHPTVLDAYRQEYLAGEAEDSAWSVATGGSTRVPYGPVHPLLTTLEATRVEPGLYDKKVYAQGIGLVVEQAITGPIEKLSLYRIRS
jgi:hypothetical protein